MLDDARDFRERNRVVKDSRRECGQCLCYSVAKLVLLLPGQCPTVESIIQ